MAPISSSWPAIKPSMLHANIGNVGFVMSVDTDPYYQPPIEDGDSFLGRMNKYSGQAEEDDGLISAGNRGNQDGRTSTSMNGGAGGDCYLMNRDSDGLTRKNSPGMNYITRHVCGFD